MKGNMVNSIRTMNHFIVRITLYIKGYLLENVIILYIGWMLYSYSKTYSIGQISGSLHKTFY